MPPSSSLPPYARNRIDGVALSGAPDLALFARPAARPSSAREEQERQLARVSDRIRDAVIEWCAGRIGRPWHMSELVGYVRERI